MGGIIREVRFTEGRDVNEGDVLFVIDPRPYRAALDQALANLARDAATAATAESNARRYAGLVGKDYVTEQQADDMASAAAAAKAGRAGRLGRGGERPARPSATARSAPPSPAGPEACSSTPGTWSRPTVTSPWW